MKKKIIIAVLLCIALIGIYSQMQIQTDTIKIGLITTLSGELSNFGEGTLNSVRLAVDEINASGGINGRQIELIVEDSPCNPQTATSAVNKLVNIDKVDAIAGPICSSELLAIAPILNENQVTIISSSATNPAITDSGDYIFRVVASDDLRAEVFAKYIFNEKNIKEIAIIYENDDAGVGYKEAFEKFYLSYGGKIIIQETYEQGSNDMRVQLTKLKEKNPENILMIAYPAETGFILKQSSELGINAQFFQGFEIMSDPQVAEIAGDLVNGVIYIQPTTPSNNSFLDKYLAQYGKEPPFYSAEAYDIIKIYSQAMLRGTDKDTIKNQLYNVKDYEGVSGIISFNSKGDIVKPFDIGQIQNQELVTISVIGS